MEVVSIKKYKIGKLSCRGCGAELHLTELKRVVLKDSSAVYVCNPCALHLSKICDIPIEDVDNPNIAECAECLIRFKCFTTRHDDDE